jgi:hypothetical protein
MVRRTLQIPPSSSPGLIAAPAEIFRLLAPEAEALSWMIWGDLWLTAKPGGTLDVLALEKQVREAPSGVPVPWPDLLSLVEDLTQIIDGTFIGSANAPVLPPGLAAGLADVHRTYELVVTADDSSFWWISAEASVLQRFLQTFPQSIDRDGYA